MSCFSVYHFYHIVTQGNKITERLTIFLRYMSQYSRYTTDCQSLTRHFFISFSIVHTNNICLIHIYSGIQSKLKCTIVWIHKSSPALFFFIFPSWNQIPMCTYLSFETLLFYFSHPFSLPIHPAL